MKVKGGKKEVMEGNLRIRGKNMEIIIPLQLLQLDLSKFG